MLETGVTNLNRVLKGYLPIQQHQQSRMKQQWENFAERTVGSTTLRGGGREHALHPKTIVKAQMGAWVMQEQKVLLTAVTSLQASDYNLVIYIYNKCTWI